MALFDNFKNRFRRPDEAETEPTETVEAASVIGQAVTSETIKKARKELRQYKTDKKHFDQKTIDNEDWWKLRHWEQMRKKDEKRPAASAWLWNVIVSKSADAYDAYPEPNILPRMSDDVDEAKKLSSIIPVVLDQNDFKVTYNEVQSYKNRQGTGVYGIFWDNTKHNGLGDITIKKVDPLSLFWEGGISDIQDSKSVFYEHLVHKETIEEQYPELKDKLKGRYREASEYRYDDTVNTDDKVAVVDWYYRKGGKLHYCKFVEDEVLFATENQPEQYPNGWYDHGKYPFEFDVLFNIEGTPCGYGYIDICKDTQEQLDVLNDALIRNAVMASKPRYFVRGDGSINEEEFGDWTKDFVHTNMNLGQDSIAPISVPLLSGTFQNLVQMKVEELKETSGNRDASNGGSASGVTAASAIAAMQEASGKLSRASSGMAYECYKRVIKQCIELIRQFYDAPRQFRIIGESGHTEFTQYSNENLKPIHQGMMGGVDFGYRVPEFDIDVSAQKASPYTKMSQNELALQFYNLGFFEPQRTDVALACLDMMDFDRKDDVVENIERNGTMQQRLVQVAQIALTLAKDNAPEMMPMIAQAVGIGGGAAPVSGEPTDGLVQTDSLGGMESDEHHRVSKARATTQQSVMPV